MTDARKQKNITVFKGNFKRYIILFVDLEEFIFDFNRSLNKSFYFEINKHAFNINRCKGIEGQHNKLIYIYNIIQKVSLFKLNFKYINLGSI